MLMCQVVVMLHVDTQKIEFGQAAKGVLHGPRQNHGALCQIMQIECWVYSSQSTANSAKACVSLRPYNPREYNPVAQGHIACPALKLHPG